MKDDEKEIGAYERDAWLSYLERLATVRREWGRWSVASIRVPSERWRTYGESLARGLEAMFEKFQAQCLIGAAGTEIIISLRLAVEELDRIIPALRKIMFVEVPARISRSGMEDRGIDLIERTAKACGVLDDIHIRMSLIRLRRQSNKFLVIDDDPLQCRILDQLLKPFGAVEVVHFADEFTRAYCQSGPTMGFIDLHLRGGRGDRLISEIRNTKDARGHLVLVTADASMENVLEAKKLGAITTLVKPIRKDHVRKVVLSCPWLVGRMV